MKTTYTNEQLQEAIDEACKDALAAHPEADDALALNPYFFPSSWEEEKTARLTLARAFLDNLPEPQPPDEKPELKTFEAHGKTWTRHTPGDPMPCDGEAMVEVCIGEDLRKRPADKASNWNWEKWTTVRGWRYADEPLVTKSDSSPEWTPQVGDVVRLKSGGPLMTVMQEIGYKFLCAYDSFGEVKTVSISTACLELATKEDAL